MKPYFTKQSKSINQSINQISIIMKNSILILGIALVSLTNVCNASSIIKHKNNTCQESVSDEYNVALLPNAETTVKKTPLNEESETFNPGSVILYNNVKTIKEIIAENDMVTEYSNSDDLDFLVYEQQMKEVIAQSDLVIENTVSNEVYPLYFERTMEDEIAELEMIIESTVSNEIRPLDFKKINEKTTILNVFNSKTFVGMN
jgi:hypothetical protein